MTMRMLHVHSGNLYGGVETILTTLARRRAACPNFHQHFALCFEGRLSSELADLGAPAESLGPVRVSRPMTLLRGRHELRKLIVRGAFDAIVFHSAWSHAVFAPVARTAQVPIVVWMHGTTGGRHWTERWARRTAPDLVICNSRFTARDAAAVFPEASKHVLYCPLELSSTPLSSSDRKKVRAELNTPADAVVIVQVSRIERLKGQLLHLEALSRLSSIQGWVCWFAGGPQRPEEDRYFEEIRSEAIRLGIGDRVRFLNERSDVPQLLQAADIYCQPNLHPESFGITFVEALNAGLPVVSTSMGGVTEIVDETCGMLASPDAEAIADMLRRLIEQPRLRQRLAQGGPARAHELCDPAARIRELSGILAGVVRLQVVGS
jgi:glycosyltransferase involved in cell wall biosynthesis